MATHVSDTGGGRRTGCTYPHDRVPPARPPPRVSGPLDGRETEAEDCTGQKAAHVAQVVDTGVGSQPDDQVEHLVGRGVVWAWLKGGVHRISGCEGLRV